MMPKTEAHVTLHIPQLQLQAVETRLTDYLLHSQYAFVQSFSGGLDTTFNIFFDPSMASTLESAQLVLCPTTHDTAVVVMPDRSLNAAPQSAHLAALLERLVAMCTAYP